MREHRLFTLARAARGERVLNAMNLIVVVGFESACGTWDYKWNALRGVFLRDPNPYLRAFRKKPRKTPNG